MLRKENYKREMKESNKEYKSLLYRFDFSSIMFSYYPIKVD